MTARYDYRRWDGTQTGDGLDADALLDGLTDDLLAGGNLDDALRRLLRGGTVTDATDAAGTAAGTAGTAGGGRLPGLRDLLEQLRQRRKALSEQVDPDGRLQQLNQQLDRITDRERDAVDQMEHEAAASGDQRRAQVTGEVAAERRMALDLQPTDPAGRVRALQHYQFVSSEAREQFEQLLDQLRQEVTDTYFQGASEALASTDPEQAARLRDAFDALSTMLEQRQRGEPLDPGFEDFRQRYGDLFPGADSLDQLLEQLAARMAAAEAMWRSLSAEQRDQLRRLAESLLEDLDLCWQVERLSQNLQRAYPDAGWQQSYSFGAQSRGREGAQGQGRGRGGGRAGEPAGARPSGPLSYSLSDATDVSAQLAELDRMEELLQSASTPAALSEMDLEQVARHLGEDAARSLERLAGLTRTLEEAGLVAQRGGRTELTPKGVRRLGQRALHDVFARLDRRALGDHRAVWPGTGHDHQETSKPYQHGDPLELHLSRTVHNAVRRSGAGVPVRLQAEDFEVVEREALARSATVLAVDLSMSMPMRDNFVPAKKMAMALQTLIASRYPRDYLGVVGFSEVAREIRAEELPSAMWDYVYGTNLQHALVLSRRLLAHQHGTKQIIVVTDGEPTAHVEDDGEVFFNWPPVAETLRRTMAEVVRCTRAGITINVFALDLERTRYPFVEQIARVNGGRTFFTTPGELGGYVLVDFLAHRRLLRPAG